MTLRRALVPALLITTAPAALQALQPAVPRQHAAEWERLLAAEDARGRRAGDAEVLRQGLHSPEPTLRAMAVRALGRFERADLLPDILPLLADTAADVAAAAANAAGQAVLRGDEAARRNARAALLRALEARAHDHATPVLLETLGRIRHADPAEAQATVALLAARLHAAVQDDRPGALRGLYFLARQQGARAAFDTAAMTALRSVAVHEPDDAATHAARVRVLALATLAAAGGIDAPALRAALRDVAPFVRREAVVASAALADTTAAHDVVMRGLQDGSGVVRYEALRQYGRRFAASHGCAPVRAAVHDTHPHTALLALEVLAGCRDADDRAMLRSIIAGMAPDDPEWHRAARALVSLATVDAREARVVLPRFVEHGSFFVRSWVARAAANAADTATLRRLAADPHANVRTAAVQGLQRLIGRDGDSIYIAQLERTDSELLQVAAAALDGSPHPAAVPALLSALQRVTQLRQETSRDARRALLVRIRQLGSSAHAAALQPYVRDFDAVIANQAADILGAWTGTRPEPRPSPPPPLPLPSWEEVHALARARVLVEMEDGATIELRLLAFDAPTNAARFARLADAGWYDGLTLHRVVPNFVVQGGSPGANEYAGDGPFSRDELGLAANWRGTVGLSTRGRDTGDAQFYINTVDNVRLDHEYTVFAEVVRGMDAVDGLLEGATMRSVRVLR